MRAAIAIGLAALLTTVTVQAQQTDYPTKPIRILVPFQAGGAYDVTARLLASWLQKNWGQPVIVENRIGAAGNVATDAVVKASPDGYTLLSHGNNVTYQHLFTKSTPFRATRDLSPIAIFGGSGTTITVPISVPATTLAEFVAFVKANPGKVNYGNPSGVLPEMEDLYSRLGLKMTAINYQGMAGAVSGLLSGDLHMLLLVPLQVTPLVKDGRVRAIAYTGERRHPAMPDVPTVTESGLTNFSWEYWAGLFGPVGLPPAVIGKLNTAVAEVTQTPEAAERFRALGLQPASLSPEGIRQRMLVVEKTAIDVVTRLKIEPQ